jgi:CRP/FNR family cyclic AMP-dependent transcriptional regulator
VTLQAECQTLQQIPMFRDLDPAKLKLLAFAAERMGVEKGEIVYRAGDPSDAVYVLLSGEVDVLHSQIWLARLSCGAVFGEIGVLCARPRANTLVAVSEISLLRIERNLFFEFLQEMPQMAIALSRGLGRRLDDMNERFVGRAAGGGVDLSGAPDIQARSKR